MLTAVEVLPPWLECASSMMMAKRLPPLLVPDLVEDERELLYCRDDDLLAALDKFAEVTRVFGMADGGPDLSELLDRVADLLVEDAPVGDHNDGIERLRVVLPETNQLVGEPGDGVGLPAAGRMMNEISLPCAVLASIIQEPDPPRRADGSAARSAPSSSCLSSHS